MWKDEEWNKEFDCFLYPHFEALMRRERERLLTSLPTKLCIEIRDMTNFIFKELVYWVVLFFGRNIGLFLLLI